MTRIVAGLVALTLLSACGIKGDLARPDPLWNREDAIRHECAQAARDNRRQDPRCAQYQSGAAASQTPSSAEPPRSPTSPPAQTSPQ